MSERMKALVKEETNSVDLLRNLDERINLKDVSKMVMAMHKLGGFSLLKSTISLTTLQGLRSK